MGCRELQLVGYCCNIRLRVGDLNLSRKHDPRWDVKDAQNNDQGEEILIGWQKCISKGMELRPFVQTNIKEYAKKDQKRDVPAMLLVVNIQGKVLNTKTWS